MNTFDREYKSKINAELDGYSVGEIEKLQTSAIIGYVDLVDIVTDSKSPWALPSEDGKQMYHWVLENATLLHLPIKGILGKLSLWDFDTTSWCCSKYGL